MGNHVMARLLVIALCFTLLAGIYAEDVPAASEAEEGAPNPEEDGAKEMAEMDKDKDGKATLDEIKGFMKEKYYSKPEDLKDLENDDGKPATPEDVTKLLDELDKDKSKDLSLEEVVAQYKDDAEEPEGDEEPEMDDDGEGDGDGDEDEAAEE